MAIGHRIKLAFAAGAGAALLAAAPVAAQNYSDGYKFLQAVEKSDVDKVKELVNKNSTILNSRDVSDGHTALHTVTQRRDSTWMRYLLTMGEDPNIADKKGVTPLMLASQLGYVEGIAILAAKGARIDNTNDAGETPLMLAVHKHDIQMVRILLAAGGDPDRSDNSGRTSRDYAKIEGFNQALEEFAKVDKSGRKKAGQTYGPSL